MFVDIGQVSVNVCIFRFGWQLGEQMDWLQSIQQNVKTIPQNVKDDMEQLLIFIANDTSDNIYTSIILVLLA